VSRRRKESPIPATEAIGATERRQAIDSKGAPIAPMGKRQCRWCGGPADCLRLVCCVLAMRFEKEDDRGSR